MNKKVFTLNKFEQQIVEMVGNARHEQNCSVGRGKGTINKINDSQLDIIGFGAEFIFCRELNLFPDFKIEIFSKNEGTDHYDCVYKNKTFDIKANRNYKNPLMIPAHLKSDCDFFALFSCIYPRYRFEGFATNEMVYKKENLRMTRIKSFVLEKSKLLTLKQLKL
tara:strand:- start:693 stop:1187 length:495 start_codon:yes stop_codon:yes gene_type:complete